VIKYNESWFRGRRVLILGATGFMGQYLVRALERMGADITILAHNQPVMEALPDLKRIDSPRIRILQGDLCDPLLLLRLVAEQELIYGLAGKSGVVQSNKNPMHDLDINCRGLLNLLESCRMTNPSVRVVFPSSRLEYRKAETLPVPETYPTEPRSIYGIHKVTGEKYLSLRSTLCPTNCDTAHHQSLRI